jgi:hypothetical protein
MLRSEIRPRRTAAAWCILPLALLYPRVGVHELQASSRGERTEMLMIAADRVSGFVPFNVTVYGKMRGAAPDSVELCRSAVEPLFKPASRREVETGSDPDSRQTHGEAVTCAPAQVVPSEGGYSFERDLRFDEPGIYQIRLTMKDARGRRVSSNTVRVAAY